MAPADCLGIGGLSQNTFQATIKTVGFSMFFNRLRAEDLKKNKKPEYKDWHISKLNVLKLVTLYDGKSQLTIPLLPGEIVLTEADLEDLYPGKKIGWFDIDEPDRQFKRNQLTVQLEDLVGFDDEGTGYSIKLSENRWLLAK